MIYYEQVEGIETDTQDPTKLSEVGILRLSSVPMFQTHKAGSWWPWPTWPRDDNYYHIPLYEPTVAELRLVGQLEFAFFNGKRVRIATRNSVFFGQRKIITAARVMK